MESSIIIYLIKVTIPLVLLYGLYMICLRDDTFNMIKRFYLLSIIFISLLFPFCNLSINIPLKSTYIIYQAILPEVTVNMEAEKGIVSLTNIIYTILLLLFAIGVIILLTKLIIQLFTIIKLKLNNTSGLYNNRKIIILKGNSIPFSFFSWIFMPDKIISDENSDTIFTHEEIHARQFHSFDIILSELFFIFFWWNPVAWLLKREIKLNLEYIADQGVINKGFEAKKYQYLLLQIRDLNTNIQVVNNFNVSQLKKRITMINKKESKKTCMFKYLLMLPVVSLILTVNASNKSAGLVNTEYLKGVSSSRLYSSSESIEFSQNKTEIYPQKDDAYTVVEEMPQFPGGESELMKYIGTNLKYPTIAAENAIEGRIVVRYIISKSGEVKNTEIIRSLDPSCDAEALRVVREMPTWTPGKQDGNVVDVYYTLPIVFKLRKETSQNKK